MRISTIGYSYETRGLRISEETRCFRIASIATMAACIFLFGLFLFDCY